MDWLLFVFKRGFKHYLVPAESIDDAWNRLAKRQSISFERCQKEYEYLNNLNANSKIMKI